MAIQDLSATTSSHKRNLEDLVDKQDPRYVGTGPYECLEGSGLTPTLVPGPLLSDGSLKRYRVRAAHLSYKIPTLVFLVGRIRAFTALKHELLEVGDMLKRH